jgi:hypothetical protein
MEESNQVTELIAEPTRTIPKGLVAGVLTLFGLMTFTLFVAASLAPGLSSVYRDDDNSIVAEDLFMNHGWKAMGLHHDVGEWLVIPHGVRIHAAVSQALPGDVRQQPLPAASRG